MFVRITTERTGKSFRVVGPNRIREVTTRSQLARELGVYLIGGDEFARVCNKLCRIGELTLERNLGKSYQV